MFIISDTSFVVVIFSSSYTHRGFPKDVSFGIGCRGTEFPCKTAFPKQPQGCAFLAVRRLSLISRLPPTASPEGSQEIAFPRSAFSA
ncbi:MAG: hypothetical protein J6Z36_04400 [Clostridia bacterium]|nr:hypothetical protein [Clostridia bacterium]